MQEEIFNLVVVGPSGAGKTTLVRAFIEERFAERHEATRGVDVYTLTVRTEKRRSISLRVADVGGSDDFRPLAVQYLANADAVMLVHDVSQSATRPVQDWIADILRFAPSTVHTVVVGNKTDVVDHARVEADRALGKLSVTDTLRQYDFQVLNLCARDNDAVYELFRTTAIALQDTHGSTAAAAAAAMSAPISVKSQQKRRHHYTPKEVLRTIAQKRGRTTTPTAATSTTTVPSGQSVTRASGTTVESPRVSPASLVALQNATLAMAGHRPSTRNAIRTLQRTLALLVTAMQRPQWFSDTTRCESVCDALEQAVNRCSNDFSNILGTLCGDRQVERECEKVGLLDDTRVETPPPRRPCPRGRLPLHVQTIRWRARNAPQPPVPARRCFDRALPPSLKWNETNTRAAPLKRFVSSECKVPRIVDAGDRQRVLKKAQDENLIPELAMGFVGLHNRMTARVSSFVPCNVPDVDSLARGRQRRGRMPLQRPDPTALLNAGPPPAYDAPSPPYSPRHTEMRVAQSAPVMLDSPLRQSRAPPLPQKHDEFEVGYEAARHRHVPPGMRKASVMEVVDVPELESDYLESPFDTVSEPTEFVAEPLAPLRLRRR